MAWQIDQRGRCGKCGTSPWEWDDDPDAYEPDGLMCLGCEALDKENERRRDEPAVPGISVVLYRKGTADGP